MKFLCERCKAKYQISDERIIGRTVRMKCRKCGHLIEVEASVTETSVASRLPVAERPSAPAPGDKPGGAEKGVTVPSAAASRVVPAAAKPPAAPPRRPTAGAGAGAGSAQMSTAPRPGAQSAAGAAAASAAVPSSGAAPRSTGAGTGTALAGAFNKTVASAPKELPSTVSAAMEVLSGNAGAEEWYVGINGVPVGPVRLSELRRKAATGAITEDSLVWREGFEEWVPLRTFPELKALLTEAAARTSLVPAPPAPPPPKTAPPPPAPVATPSPSPLRPPSPAVQRLAPAASRPTPIAARSNVVSINSRLATAEKLEIESSPVEGIAADAESGSMQGAAARPAAAAESAGAAAKQAASPSERAELTAGAAFEASSPASSPNAIEAADEARVSSYGRRSVAHRRIHPAAWAVVGLVGVLVGMGGAFVLLSSKPAPAPSVQVVTVPVPAPAPVAADSAPQPTTIGAVEVAAAPTSGKGSGGAANKGSSADSKAGAQAAPALNPSLSGLSGLVNGPKAGPVGGAAGGGGQLNTTDVERVVQSSRGLVKRQCWEPALSGRTSGSPASARVVVALNIGADGRVESADATGGDGYPGLASCVEQRVRTWRFPPSEGGSVSVPFVFAAQ